MTDGFTYEVPEIKSVPRYGHIDNDPSRPGVVGYNDKKVTTDLSVPNGTWVMMCAFSQDYSWLVGASPDDVRCELIDRRPLKQRDLQLADKPFGYVCANEARRVPGTDTMVPAGPMYLYCAEQVHNGKLRLGVEIPKLRFARERLDGARSPHRWARLSDVVVASGMTVYDLMNDFWPFVGNGLDRLRDPYYQLLHVRFGDSPAEISSQSDSLPHYLELDELTSRINGGQDTSSIWIRSGLANTFLRLCALDCRSLVSTPAT